jgi:hypothetical protein
MVEVVNAGSPISSTTDILQQTISFFQNNWLWMLVFAVIVILIIIIFMLMNKVEDERKERDEPGYQLYKTVMMAAYMNKDDKLIRRVFNWSTLPLIFIPVIGWILMIVIKREMSAKIMDYNNNLIGYYRGDYISQDNTWNFRIYKEKWLFFFEQEFILKAPLYVYIKKVRKNDKGEIIWEDNKKTIPLYDEEKVSFRNYIQKLPDGNFKIICSGIEPIGMYYKCPVYMMEHTGEAVDYRKILEGAIVDNTYQLMSTRLLNTAAKQMEKGMTFSPDLQFRKQVPVKTKEEEKSDEFASSR